MSFVVRAQQTDTIAKLRLPQILKHDLKSGFCSKQKCLIASCCLVPHCTDVHQNRMGAKIESTAF